ncbi:MAG: hypothetical protein D6718_04055 [Acidobacteria bacterium]|nr:MAG: hypothetical protein D6718_04055 [Acidobacteriota bacterium]
MERAHTGPQITARREGSPHALRPVDAFVVGGDVAWETGENLWLLLSRPGEKLIDFFIEDEDDAPSVAADPAPFACAGVRPDGTVLVGAIDWETDRFLSELLDEQEEAARR